MTAREAEVAANLAAVRRRLARAAEDAGRDPAAVTLVVVTKTFPASDVRALAALGIPDVGENRDQEAAAKAAELADLTTPDGVPLRWHFVGQLQTNKAGSVAGYAALVHSVDRPRLVGALDAAAGRAGRGDRATVPLRCLVQVSLDPPGGGSGTLGPRGGVRPGGLLDLAAEVAAAAHLELAGLMAVAPPGGDPAAAFERLAALAADLRAAHPAATVLSAGMSGDFEAAVRHGATHVRLGAAVLGPRGARH